MKTDATVYVVDDDAGLRRALKLLLESSGHTALSYASAEDFLDGYQPGRPGCLVLDLKMPGLSGLALQEEMRTRGILMPIIILTGHGDVPSAVKAMRGGAIDFLQKPYEGEKLLERIDQCLALDVQRLKEAAAQEEIDERMAKLTPRERDVMWKIVDGQANKVIALDLEISERTVELHRSRLMRKMETRSVADLTRAVLASSEGGKKDA